MRLLFASLISLTAAWTGSGFAADPPTSEPRPIPLTRPEMKQSIEEMKDRKPRFALPELTEEEKTKLGERGNNYEGRLRFHYLPDGVSGNAVFGFGGGGGGAGADPAMTLDNTFKIELFWIVCRANNCQYCQGHQESKLLRAGLKEDIIAALDGDWAGFPEKERAAFAFARKITYEPHTFGEADYKALKKHYSDMQILEMLMSVAGNNAINRWKEGVGVPQSASGGGFGRGAEPTEKHTYLTPTPEQYKDSVSKVAPIVLDDKGKPTQKTVSQRPALESREEVEKFLKIAAERSSRIPLADDEKTRVAMPEGYPKDAALPQWARLLASFDSTKGRIASQIAADEKGDLPPLLKAQVSWIIARQDRAWYAAAEAKARLKKLEQSDDRIYALDGDWKGFTETERALFTVAKKLAASPVVLTDDDAAKAVKLAGTKTVVQLVTHVTVRASFDRITEAAGLQAGK